jgi:hypothetical protein
MFSEPVHLVIKLHLGGGSCVGSGTVQWIAKMELMEL